MTSWCEVAAHMPLAFYTFWSAVGSAGWAFQPIHTDRLKGLMSWLMGTLVGILAQMLGEAFIKGLAIHYKFELDLCALYTVSTLVSFLFGLWGTAFVLGITGQRETIKRNPFSYLKNGLIRLLRLSLFVLTHFDKIDKITADNESFSQSNRNNDHPLGDG
ncbi:hypothetical protein FAES_3230 [Fibrella aestuarina BUZ 2]|uniref:Uncharacterized protein n=1 Tax=Fibrella aestuarina BUZ 2 TaxID=1166018 RepID=I0KAT6_9BACT|nr:hypothetical protein [Fibrella aestuarina]CCH01239.1 hypothetical protein FAES_3230 [Fibrella aestuarina BUZ 2]